MQHTHLINEDIFNNKIVSLLPKKYKTLDFLVVEIKGQTNIKDCTKLVIDKIRFDYINNQLVKL